MPVKSSSKTRPNLGQLAYPKVVILSIFLNFLTLLILLVLSPKLPPEVPLFYGAAEGKDQLGPLITLALPPVISIAVVAINSLIAMMTTDEFMKKVLISTSLVVSILSTISFVKIVFLVGAF